MLCLLALFFGHPIILLNLFPDRTDVATQPLQILKVLEHIDFIVLVQRHESSDVRETVRIGSCESRLCTGGGGMWRMDVGRLAIRICAMVAGLV